MTSAGASAAGLRYGVYLPPMGPLGDPRALVDLARRAEAGGWDGVFLWDHVLTDMPPIVDTWTTLGAIAAVTSSILLGPMVTPIPRRRPWVVALEGGACLTDPPSGWVCDTVRRHSCPMTIAHAGGVTVSRNAAKAPVEQSGHRLFRRFGGLPTTWQTLQLTYRSGGAVARVFSDRKRTNTTPMSRESSYAFLDRAAGPVWDTARLLIEQMVARTAPTQFQTSSGGFGVAEATTSRAQSGSCSSTKAFSSSALPSAATLPSRGGYPPGLPRSERRLVALRRGEDPRRGQS